jgi:hypothetical protein
MINLDYICAKTGQEISTKAEENIFRKALGILQEDGVYAMFLWLENKDKNVREILYTELLKNDEIKKQLLCDSSGFLNKDFKNFCEQLQKVSADIDKLFFLKKILERTLTYALYHARIKGEKNVDKA